MEVLNWRRRNIIFNFQLHVFSTVHYNGSSCIQGSHTPRAPHNSAGQLFSVRKYQIGTFNSIPLLQTPFQAFSRICLEKFTTTLKANFLIRSSFLIREYIGHL